MLPSSTIAHTQSRRASSAAPLNTLLAGYTENVLLHSVQVSSPERALRGPLAAQESSMYLNPAQLAKGEKVQRIVDFKDKIVSNTECSTITCHLLQDKKAHA